MAVAIQPSTQLSHWSTMVEGLEASPKGFYDRVEKVLEEKLVPDLVVSRVQWKEGGLLSAKREYLQVKRFGHVYHICGAPFGNGFFVSSWLGEVQGCLSRILSVFAFLSDIIPFLDRRATYYQIDTAMMFQSLTHSAVLAVVDEFTKAKGLRTLSELERKPVMKDFLTRSLLG